MTATRGMKALDEEERQQVASTRSDAILDAAESVFASGYAGASMREIAERAGVAQALIHYHFDTKEKLFEAVVARRAGQINGMRAEMLDALFAASPTPRLEDVIEALFRPTIAVGHGHPNGFARILVSMANSAEPRDQALTQRYYDEIAQKFIDAIIAVTPDLTRKEAVWAYMFAIGVGMTMMATTGRSTRLSQGEADDRDIEAMLARIVPFICSGIRALADESAGEFGKT
ncbi:MAG TPA: TetR/AcrR family transcriptional regulator [Rhizobiaceae bacterium]|nr:TetR/AcrR family transcriptional regulator [Rhizobiaceae bacterium]